MTIEQSHTIHMKQRKLPQSVPILDVLFPEREIRLASASRVSVVYPISVDTRQEPLIFVALSHAGFGAAKRRANLMIRL
jgi:hypothetical protein